MKTEPTVGNFLVTAGKFVGVVKSTDHEALVADALDSFTKAEQKMEGAINQINAQIEQEQKEIALAKLRVDAAEQSMGKLARVLSRFKALTE